MKQEELGKQFPQDKHPITPREAELIYTIKRLIKDWPESDDDNGQAYMYAMTVLRRYTK